VPEKRLFKGWHGVCYLESQWSIHGNNEQAKGLNEMTQRVTIEVNQCERNAWVGVVRERKNGDRVVFVSRYECTATLAFMDCTDWLEERDSAEERAADQSAGAVLDGHALKMVLL
jgi:hypothetical protein